MAELVYRQNGPVSSGERVGILTVISMDTNHWQASFVPENAPDAHYEIHAALLSDGIISDVKAGENKGCQLEHDFVVVSLAQIGMAASNGW